MKTKKHYKEKAWLFVNTPCGTYAEKPIIKFLSEDEYGVHFLINNIKITFINYNF